MNYTLTCGHAKLDHWNLSTYYQQQQKKNNTTLTPIIINSLKIVTIDNCTSPSYTIAFPTGTLVEKRYQLYES